MIVGTVTLSGTEGFQSGAREIEKLFSDYRPVFQRVGPTFFEQTRKRFEAEGPGWPALTPAYAERKRQIYGDRTILRATDRLYHSFQPKGRDSIERIGPLEAEFGSSVPYGIHHQEERPIIDVNEQQIEQVVVDGLNEQIRSLGF